MGKHTWIGRSWNFLRAIWTTVGERNLGLIAAGVAFFGMFAIFPALAALIAVFGLLADPVIVAEQLALLEEIIPIEVFNILTAQIDRLLGAQSNTLGWATVVSIVLALWAARAKFTDGVDDDGVPIWGVFATRKDTPKDTSKERDVS